MKPYLIFAFTVCSVLLANVRSEFTQEDTNNVLNVDSNERTAPFRSPLHPLPDHEYKHPVIFKNKRVDQIRLDFVKFELQLPSFKMSSGQIECMDDSFIVEEPTKNQVPILCGTQTGQHVYLHIDRQKVPTKLYLRVRIGSYGNRKQAWNIEITQIENAFSDTQFLPLNQQPNFENFAGSLRAPDIECLQYFPARSSLINSLGYLDHIHYSFNYSMCFNRELCRSYISFQVQEFLIEEDEVFDCNPITCESFVTINKGIMGECTQDKFCGKIEHSTDIEYPNNDYFPRISFSSTQNLRKKPGFSILHSCNAQLDD